MYLRRIHRGSPEKVYIVVRNSTSATTAYVGRGMVWAYAQQTSSNDGVNCEFFAATTHRQWMLAGVVVRAPIPPGDYGMLQCFGHCDSVAVSAYGATPAAGLTNWTVLKTYILNLTNATSGYFINVSVTGMQSEQDAVVHPVDTRLNGSGSTVYASNSTGYVKAFIRAL